MENMEKVKKKKSKTICCVVGCSNTYSNTTGIVFYSFPTRYTELQRRQKWIQAVNRIKPDGSPWEPNQWSTICSAHFIGNKRSPHPHSPAFVPTIFPGVQRSEKSIAKDKQAMERFQRALNRRVLQSQRQQQLRTQQKHPPPSASLDKKSNTEDVIMQDPLDISYAKRDVVGDSMKLKAQIETDALDIINLKPEESSSPGLASSGSTIKTELKPQTNTYSENTSIITEEIECKDVITDNNNSETFDKNSSLKSQDSTAHQQEVVDLEDEDIPNVIEKCRTALVFLCEVCGKVVKHVYWCRHQLMHTKPETSSKCEICDKILKDKQKLKVHLETHTDHRPHVCGVCKKSFLRRFSLNRHMITHSKAKPFQCEGCNIAFTKHWMLLKNYSVSRRKEYFTCNVCGKSSYFRIAGKKSKPFSCSVCSLSFLSLKKLDRHKITHSEVKPIPCDSCFKTFSHKKDLESHQVIHSGVKSFSCEICDKSFYHKSSVYTHMKVHVTVEPR